MTFKEFMDWCNQRACDGCWGMNLAMFCIEIMQTVRKQPFWKREKKWQELKKEHAIEEIVNAISQRIEEVYGNG